MELYDLASPHPSARLLIDVPTAAGITVKVVRAKNVGPASFVEPNCVYCQGCALAMPKSYTLERTPESRAL